MNDRGTAKHVGHEAGLETSLETFTYKRRHTLGDDAKETYMACRCLPRKEPGLRLNGCSLTIINCAS